MKKSLSFLLAVIMVLSCIFAFAGCSKKDNGSYEIVLITDGQAINDGSYNESAWNGVKSYGDENKVTYRYYQPNLDDDGNLSIDTISDYVKLAADNGAKYIVMPGESFAVAAYKVAHEYKNINFVLADAFPHSEEDNNPRLQSNVMCVNFNALQAGFLAGYTSVIDGNTKLGYLGSVNSPNSGDYGAGYVQGAAYAADEKGVPVTLDYADYDSAVLDYDYSFTVKPVYQKISEAKEKTFTVKVEGGLGSGTYTDGENVAIMADDPAEGKIFDHWEVKSDTKGVKDKKVNISSKKDSTMNLLVGDCDCTIKAVWAKADTVPVKIMQADGKTLYRELNVSKDSTNWVSAPAAESGKIFDYWQVKDESVLEDAKSASTNVSVADKGVTLVPVYKNSDTPTFDVTVENGTGSGSYVAGDTVNLVADAPKEGYMFYKWENIDNQGLSTGIAMENEYNYNTSFEMVDRYSSVAEKMYDDGVTMMFAGGNAKSDSIFTASTNFDYQVWTFGSGTDQHDKDNCYASVVNDYGAAVKLCLKDYKGGSILSAGCNNNCIYVTGKNIEEYQLDENSNPAKDKDGNRIKNDDYNKDYSTVYKALAAGMINPVSVQSGGDVRKVSASKCLSLDYWVVDGAFENAEILNVTDDAAAK